MEQANGAASHAPINLAAVVVDENTPRASLGGIDWPIPKLAIKHNRVIVPKLVRVVPLLKLYAEAAKANQLPELSEDDIELLTSIAYTACTRAKPGLGRNEFDNLPITILELIGAIDVIAEATGMMKKGPAPGEPKPGPAPADQPVEATTLATLT